MTQNISNSGVDSGRVPGFRRWVLVVALIAAGAAAGATIYLFRTRGGTSASDLVSYLPSAGATLVYIDVDSMRRSGILNMLAGAKAAEESEYRQFVDQTRFDYRQDLDGVAAAFKDGQVFLALSGRFHWKSLMDYAQRQGGSCHNSYCIAPGSQANRRVSFYQVRSNILAMAIGRDDFAAYRIARQPGRVAPAASNQPLWAVVPSAALKDSSLLPDGAKSYAAALQTAEQILLTIGPQGDHLELALEVTCRDAASASVLQVELENATSELRKLIAKERQQPNPTDLTAILVAGTFRRDDRLVHGQWPIAKAFVDAVAGGSP